MNVKRFGISKWVMAAVVLMTAIAVLEAGPFRGRRSVGGGCENGNCGQVQQTQPLNTDDLKVPVEKMVGIEAKPTASLSPASGTLTAGESITLSWTTTGARKVVLASVNIDEESTTTTVASSGTLTVTPKVSTLYRIYAKKGFQRVWSNTSEIEVIENPNPPDPTPDPDPNPPDPTPPGPTPDPVEGVNFSVVAFGDAFQISDTLSSSARSQGVVEYLTATGGNWVEVSEALLKSPHHPMLDKWWDAFKASGKKLPCVATYQKDKDGKVIGLAFDEVNDNTDLLMLLKSRTPAPVATVTIHGKRYSLGFKKTPPLKRGIIAGQAADLVSEILEPKTVADIPVGGIDLRHLTPFLYDQGSYGTCVSQATNTAATSANFIQFGKRNFKLFSPNFTATRIDGWNGAWAEQAITQMIEEGCLLMSDQPDYSNRLPSDWQTKAKKRKIIGVYRSPMKNAKGYIIAALKRGYPVVVAIGVGGGFDPDASGAIGYRRGGTSSVNHEVIFCGVKVVDGQIHWLMKNSWGNWGRIGNGLAWLVEDYGNNGWVADNKDLDFWVIVRMSASPDDQFDSPN
jgi:hypothetical protein